MHFLRGVGIALACAAWGAVTPVAADTTSPVPSKGLYCREFTMPVVIDGQSRQAYGRACQMPDGTWRVMEDAAFKPPHSLGPPPPAATATGPACLDHIDVCDKSCDDHGVLGARHIHADCSRTCDLICGGREGYAPW